MIEILAINLRKNTNIEGIKIHDIVNLLCQFADDMQIFLKYSRESLQEVINELSMFENISGISLEISMGIYYGNFNLKKTDVKLILPEIGSLFWKNVIEMWAEFKFNDPISGEQVRN